MKASERDEVLTLDLPQRDTNQGYMNIFWRYYTLLAALIADDNDTTITSEKVRMMVELMISTIPIPKDPKKNKRAEIREIKDKEIDARISAHVEKNGNITNEEESRIISQVSLEIIGNITDFIDESVGISRKLEIGMV